MKCDSCIHQIVEPPTQDSPHGEFFCKKDHWEGEPKTEEKNNDPWKFCKDYKANI